MKRAILITIILLAGIALLAYPLVSNYLSEKNGSKAIQVFNEQLVQEQAPALDEQRALAEEYNASLTGQNISDPFVPGSGIVLPDNYFEIMDFANHMMGYIEIPKIDVSLPIYHGVSDEVLSKGVGHMSETAFPIGGKGNHSVLTGHTALPTAKLFTDLTELEQGDVFYIHVLNETLAYKVNQIKVVTPDKTDDLLPVAGEDYVTLITCTPYAVNSHRLLVRAERIPFVEEVHKQAVQNGGMVLSGLDRHALLYGAGGAVIVLAVIVIVLVLLRRRKKRKTNQPPKHAKK